MSDSIELKLGKYDIKVEEIENHKSNGLDASLLKLKFGGNDFNIKIANSIRRSTSNNLPTYAIPEELIKLGAEDNTTVAFNNDYMRLRLTQMPVLGVDSKLYYLPEKYWKQDLVNYADIKRPKHQNEELVEFYISSHNTTSEIINVTTHDLIMYKNGEKENHYHNIKPILLIKLRPNDKFKCYMKAVLGTGDRNVSWSASRNCYYEELDTNELLFTIEGNGQCHEYEILIRACKYLIKKYTDLKNYLKTQISTKQILPEKTIYFKIDDEDYTLGEPLNYEFQSHKNIVSSGLSKPDHLVKSILIKIEASEKVKTPLDAMMESIDILVDKLSHIGKTLENMKQKTKSK